MQTKIADETQIFMFVPYIFWWDFKGIYHQHFLTRGQNVHVSDQILRVNQERDPD